MIRHRIVAKQDMYLWDEGYLLYCREFFNKKKYLESDLPQEEPFDTPPT